MDIVEESEVIKRDDGKWVGGKKENLEREVMGANRPAWTASEGAETPASACRTEGREEGLAVSGEGGAWTKSQPEHIRGWSDGISMWTTRVTGTGSISRPGS